MLSANEPGSARSRRCAHCGDVVGVYEPAVVVLGDGEVARGSMLTLSDAIVAPGSSLFHASCHRGAPDEDRR